MPDDLQKLLKMLPHDEYSPIQATVPGPEFPGIHVEDVVEVTVGREWKIDNLVRLQN